MARLMTRLSAGVATVTLAVLGGAGPTSAAPAVDSETGPVSFANPASLEVLSDDDPATAPARLITETQRSPLGPGTSRLDQADRAAVPEQGDESGIVPNYRIGLGEHKVVASLGENHVPRAGAEIDYTLEYLTPAGSPKRVLTLSGARTAVACPGAGSVTSSASAASLRILDANGGMEEVPLPRGDGAVTRAGLPFGPPVDVQGAEGKDVSSDITISRVNSFDALLRQDEWRDGPVTAVSGWQVEIVTHITPTAKSEPDPKSEPAAKSEDAPADATSDAGTTEQSKTQRQDTAAPADVASTEIRTRIVLGGVSCSIPSDFTPVATGSGGGAAANSTPDVPVTVRAGGHAFSTGAGPVGYWVIGGGVLAGASAAVLLVSARRRRSATHETGTPTGSE